MGIAGLRSALCPSHGQVVSPAPWSHLRGGVQLPKAITWLWGAPSCVRALLFPERLSLCPAAGSFRAGWRWSAYVSGTFTTTTTPSAACGTPAARSRPRTSAPSPACSCQAPPEVGHHRRHLAVPNPCPWPPVLARRALAATRISQQTAVTLGGRYGERGVGGRKRARGFFLKGLIS